LIVPEPCTPSIVTQSTSRLAIFTVSTQFITVEFDFFIELFHGDRLILAYRMTSIILVESKIESVKNLRDAVIHQRMTGG
jgi:hypothetical protein